MFTMPNNTKDKEKNALIARTAATNSVALLSIYEYHFQALGTKKCHIPKPMEALLPIIPKILTSRFMVNPPGNS
jgi:DNA/RNA-binding domain of Phe-tRNA-synthetase-like protein